LDYVVEEHLARSRRLERGHGDVEGLRPLAVGVDGDQKDLGAHLAPGIHYAEWLLGLVVYPRPRGQQNVLQLPDLFAGLLNHLPVRHRVDRPLLPTAVADLHLIPVDDDPLNSRQGSQPDVAVHHRRRRLSALGGIGEGLRTHNVDDRLGGHSHGVGHGLVGQAPVVVTDHHVVRMREVLPVAGPVTLPAPMLGALVALGVTPTSSDRASWRGIVGQALETLEPDGIHGVVHPAEVVGQKPVDLVPQVPHEVARVAAHIRDGGGVIEEIRDLPQPCRMRTRGCGAAEEPEVEPGGFEIALPGRGVAPHGADEKRRRAIDAEALVAVDSHYRWALRRAGAWRHQSQRRKSREDDSRVHLHTSFTGPRNLCGRPGSQRNHTTVPRTAEQRAEGERVEARSIVASPGRPPANRSMAS